MFHVNIVVLAARYRYRPERRGKVKENRSPVVDAGGYRRKLGNGEMNVHNSLRNIQMVPARQVVDGNAKGGLA